ncbi:hypothetical protein OOZ19_16070, partial [Saccharopolyspora sp. NFXS83]|nr:hypothetical protein [Saccharopolyspora sp. NFXS83]
MDADDFFATLLIGINPPDVDAPSMYSMSSELRSNADGYQQEAADLHALSAGALDSVEGETAQAFYQYTRDLTAPVDQQVAAMYYTADMADEFGVNAEEAWYEVYLVGAQLAAELAFYAALGVTAAWIPARILLGRKMLQEILDFHKVFSNTAANYVNAAWQALEEAAEEVIQTLFPQGVTILQGKKDRVETDPLLVAAAAGGAASFMHSGMHWLAGLNKHTRDFVNTPLGSGVLGALSELPVDVATTLIMGGSLSSLWGTATSSIVQGASSKFGNDWSHEKTEEQLNRHQDNGGGDGSPDLNTVVDVPDKPLPQDRGDGDQEPSEKPPPGSVKSEDPSPQPAPEKSAGPPPAYTPAPVHSPGKPGTSPQGHSPGKSETPPPAYSPSTEKAPGKGQPPAAGQSPVGGQEPPPAYTPKPEQAPVAGQAPPPAYTPAPQQSPGQVEPPPAYAPQGGQVPVGGQTPPAADAPQGGQVPVGGQTPPAADAPQGGQVPVGGQTPPAADAPQGGQVPVGGQTPPAAFDSPGGQEQIGGQTPPVDPAQRPSEQGVPVAGEGTGKDHSPVDAPRQESGQGQSGATPHDSEAPPLGVPGRSPGEQQVPQQEVGTPPRGDADPSRQPGAESPPIGSQQPPAGSQPPAATHQPVGGSHQPVGTAPQQGTGPDGGLLGFNTVVPQSQGDVPGEQQLAPQGQPVQGTGPDSGARPSSVDPDVARQEPGQSNPDQRPVEQPVRDLEQDAPQRTESDQRNEQPGARSPVAEQQDSGRQDMTSPAMPPGSRGETTTTTSAAHRDAASAPANSATRGGPGTRRQDVARGDSTQEQEQEQEQEQASESSLAENSGPDLTLEREAPHERTDPLSVPAPEQSVAEPPRNDHESSGDRQAVRRGDVGSTIGGAQQPLREPARENDGDVDSARAPQQPAHPAPVKNDPADVTRNPVQQADAARRGDRGEPGPDDSVGFLVGGSSRRSGDRVSGSRSGAGSSRRDRSSRSTPGVTVVDGQSFANDPGGQQDFLDKYFPWVPRVNMYKYYKGEAGHKTNCFTSTISGLNSDAFPRRAAKGEFEARSSGLVSMPKAAYKTGLTFVKYSNADSFNRFAASEPDGERFAILSPNRGSLDNDGHSWSAHRIPTMLVHIDSQRGELPGISGSSPIWAARAPRAELPQVGDRDLDPQRDLGYRWAESGPYPEGTTYHPNGTIRFPDGTILPPDGTIHYPDGGVQHADGSFSHPDGAISHVDGSFTHPDGTINYSDGTIWYANGAVQRPDGTIEYPDGTIRHADGTVSYPNRAGSDSMGTRYGLIPSDPPEASEANRTPEGDLTGRAPASLVADLNRDGVVIAVADARSFGHQAAATTLAKSLQGLGVRGEITLVGDSEPIAKVRRLIGDDDGLRVVELGSPEWRGAGDRVVLSAADDTIGPDNVEDAAAFLDRFEANEAIVLKPYRWDESTRVHLSRPGPDADPAIVNLDERINPEAMYRFEVPRIDDPAELKRFIGEHMRGDQRVAGLNAVVDAVTGPARADLMPIYGMVKVDPFVRPSMSAHLAEAIHASNSGRPSIMLEITDSQVEYVPRHQAPWLTYADVADGDVRDVVDALGPNDVLVLSTGGLPQDVFWQVFQLGDLPAVVEGANVTNLAALVGRPYLSLYDQSTPYPRHDPDTADRLSSVTHSLAGGTDWIAAATGQENARSTADFLGEDNDLIWAMNADTALESLGTLREYVEENPDDSGMTVGDLGHMLGLLHGRGAEVTEALGGGREAGMVGRMVDTPVETRWMFRNAELPMPLTADGLDRVMGALRDERARVGERLRSLAPNAPRPENVQPIADAVREFRNPDSPLGRYVEQAHRNAHDPANDQVLQALHYRAASERTGALSISAPEQSSAETSRNDHEMPGDRTAVVSPIGGAQQPLREPVSENDGDVDQARHPRQSGVHPAYGDSDPADATRNTMQQADSARHGVQGERGSDNPAGWLVGSSSRSSGNRGSGSRSGASSSRRNRSSRSAPSVTVVTAASFADDPAGRNVFLHGYFPWVFGVNSSNYHNNVRGYRTNCVPATIAGLNAEIFPQRAAEGEFQARPDGWVSLGQISHRTRLNFVKFNSADSLRRFAAGDPEGSRFLVIGFGPGLAHAWSVHRNPGFLTHLDSQQGDLRESVSWANQIWAARVPRRELPQVSSSDPDPTDPGDNWADVGPYPEGTVYYPNHTHRLPDGRVLVPDGTIHFPNGDISYSDGTIVYSDGAISRPDGSCTYPDGTIVYSDGTFVYSDGSVSHPDGTVRYRDYGTNSYGARYGGAAPVDPSQVPAESSQADAARTRALLDQINDDLAQAPPNTTGRPRVISRETFADDPARRDRFVRRYFPAELRVNRDNFERNVPGHRTNCGPASINTLNSRNFPHRARRGEFRTRPSAPVNQGLLAGLAGLRFDEAQGYAHIEDYLTRQLHSPHGLVFQERADVGHFITAHDLHGWVAYFDGQAGDLGATSTPSTGVRFAPAPTDRVMAPTHMPVEQGAQGQNAGGSVERNSRRSAPGRSGARTIPTLRTDTARIRPERDPDAVRDSERQRRLPDSVEEDVTEAPRILARALETEPPRETGMEQDLRDPAPPYEMPEGHVQAPPLYEPGAAPPAYDDVVRGDSSRGERRDRSGRGDGPADSRQPTGRGGTAGPARGRPPLHEATADSVTRDDRGGAESVEVPIEPGDHSERGLSGVVSAETYADDPVAGADFLRDNVPNLGLVNLPNYLNGVPGADTNCAVAAVQGVNADNHPERAGEFTAAPSGPIYRQQVEAETGLEFSWQPDGYAGVREYVKGLPEGSQAVVHRDQGDGDGHFFRVKNIDGRPVFPDDQIGWFADLSTNPLEVWIAPVTSKKVLHLSPAPLEAADEPAPSGPTGRGAGLFSRRKPRPAFRAEDSRGRSFEFRRKDVERETLRTGGDYPVGISLEPDSDRAKRVKRWAKNAGHIRVLRTVPGQPTRAAAAYRGSEVEVFSGEPVVLPIGNARGMFELPIERGSGVKSARVSAGTVAEYLAKSDRFLKLLDESRDSGGRPELLLLTDTPENDKLVADFTRRLAQLGHNVDVFVGSDRSSLLPDGGFAVAENRGLVRFRVRRRVETETVGSFLPRTVRKTRYVVEKTTLASTRYSAQELAEIERGGAPRPAPAGRADGNPDGRPDSHESENIDDDHKAEVGPDFAVESDVDDDVSSDPGSDADPDSDSDAEEVPGASRPGARAEGSSKQRPETRPEPGPSSRPQQQSEPKPESKPEAKPEAEQPKPERSEVGSGSGDMYRELGVERGAPVYRLERALAGLRYSGRIKPERANEIERAVAELRSAAQAQSAAEASSGARPESRPQRKAEPSRYDPKPQPSVDPKGKGKA